MTNPFEIDRMLKVHHNYRWLRPVTCAGLCFKVIGIIGREERGLCYRILFLNSPHTKLIHPDGMLEISMLYVSDHFNDLIYSPYS